MNGTCCNQVSPDAASPTTLTTDLRTYLIFLRHDFGNTFSTKSNADAMPSTTLTSSDFFMGNLSLGCGCVCSYLGCVICEPVDERWHEILVLPVRGVGACCGELETVKDCFAVRDD